LERKCHAACGDSSSSSASATTSSAIERPSCNWLCLRAYVDGEQDFLVGDDALQVSAGVRDLLDRDLAHAVELEVGMWFMSGSFREPYRYQRAVCPV
jgi:hypothetical protein